MIIPNKVRAELIAHARRDAPVEACGYLAGDGDGIVEAFAMTNVDGREDHFSFDPAEQFAVLKRARQGGNRITGVYHSHPATPARPSAEDIRLAFDPDLLYVIVSLQDETPSIRGFRIRKGIVEEEFLEIEESS